MPTEHEHGDQSISSGEASAAPKRRPWIPPRSDRSGAGLLDEVRQTKYTTPETGQSPATTS